MGLRRAATKKPLVVLLARRHDIAVEDAMQQVMNQMRKYSMIQARRRGPTHPPVPPALRQGDAAPSFASPALLTPPRAPSPAPRQLGDYRKVEFKAF